MKQSELKSFLKQKGIPFKDFLKFMKGQSVTEREGETYYWKDDIQNFLNSREGKAVFFD